MLTHRPTSHARRSRRGLAATETLLILPVFLLILVGMIGFADLLIAEQKMDEASARAARVAAAGGSEKQMEEAVYAVLGPDRARHAKIHVSPVPAADDKGKADDDGDANDDHKKAAHHLELIEVRVELEVRHAAATKFVPLKGAEPLIGRTVVHRQ